MPERPGVSIDATGPGNDPYARKDKQQFSQSNLNHVNLTPVPLQPDNDRYPSQPFLDRRTSRRVLLAVVISVVLHLLLFFIHSPVPEVSERPRVFHAELQTDIAQRDDTEDRRGEITEEPPASVKTPAAPAPATPVSRPEARASSPEKVITSTVSPRKTPQADKQPLTEETPAQKEPVTESVREKPAPVNTPKPPATVVTPETDVTPTPSTPAPPSSLQTQGDAETFSDPLERAYYELLVAHLNARLPDHPKGIAGTVRLEIKIQYGSVITGVSIIDSSGNPLTDNWARKAALSVSPVPPVPEKFSQPYYFRPTLVLTP